ncbi:MAG: helix-turn-helix transcriptional regulator [Pseudomonadota bacterium]
MSRSAPSTLHLTRQAREAASTLGQNIRQARLRRSMTQVDLAKRLSVSPVTIGNLEKGNVSVGLGVLIMTLDILGLVDSLSLVANPEHDKVGKALEQKKPQRASRPRGLASLDF